MSSFLSDLLTHRSVAVMQHDADIKNHTAEVGKHGVSAAVLLQHSNICTGRSGESVHTAAVRWKRLR